MDFYKLSKIGLRARWSKNHLPIVKHIEENHQKFLIERARLIGFLMGDGCLNSPIKSQNKTQHHDITFYPDDLKLAEIFAKDFKKLYIKEPKIKELKNYYVVFVSCKPAWDHLRNIAKFSSLNWEFPKILSSKEEKIGWLRAMFDCEAYVCNKRNRISFQTISKSGAESIKKLLEEFEIYSRIYIYERKNPKWKTNYLLFISGKENIIKFNNLVSFNHPAKKVKLNLIAGVPERLKGSSRKRVSEKTSRSES